MKRHIFEIRKDGDLAVWWIPQVPGKAFRVPVKSLQDAALIIDTLAAQDAAVKTLSNEELASFYRLVNELQAEIESGNVAGVEV